MDISSNFLFFVTIPFLIFLILVVLLVIAILAAILIVPIVLLFILLLNWNKKIHFYSFLEKKENINAEVIYNRLKNKFKVEKISENRIKLLDFLYFCEINFETNNIIVNFYTTIGNIFLLIIGLVFLFPIFLILLLYIFLRIVSIKDMIKS